MILDVYQHGASSAWNSFHVLLTYWMEFALGRSFSLLALNNQTCVEYRPNTQNRDRSTELIILQAQIFVKSTQSSLAA
jgi:hypothetical protein